MAVEPKRPLHLLLVEDSYPDARFFETALKEAGAAVRVTTAGDGQTAVKLLDEHGSLHDLDRPDLVILDLNLPIVNGFDVLRHMKSSPSLRSIPVVVLSTSRAASDVERSYQEGAACYIAKSMDMRQYFEAIKDLVVYWSHVASLPRAAAGAEGGPAAASALIDHSESALLTKDLEGKILTWSPLAQQIYGYSAEEAIGQSVTTLIPPEAAAELPPILAALRRGEAVHDLRTVRLRKDGRRIRVSVTVSPLKDDEGRVVGAATVARELPES